jgi:hypothetical protein
MVPSTTARQRGLASGRHVLMAIYIFSRQSPIAKRRHKTVTPLTLNIRVDRPLQRQPWLLDKLGLSFLDADGPQELEHRSLPPPGRRGFFVGPFP